MASSTGSETAAVPAERAALSQGPAVAALSVHHRRRLRDVWRSAGWPCRDPIEAELLAAGLLQRSLDDQGRETLHVSDAGVAILAATLELNRRRREPHEDLVSRVALALHHGGRLVWRGLSLRAPLTRERDGPSRTEGTAPAAMRDESPAAWAAQALPLSALAALEPHTDAPAQERPARWALAMPDLFSVRNTTVEAYVEPVIHEIKVRRADLLADVRHADKRAAYLALASECWYVLREGIGSADDVPDTCGVLVATATGFEVMRPAPRRAARPSFAMWMALAKATRCDFGDDAAQTLL